jgi:hypothetical protein
MKNALVLLRVVLAALLAFPSACATSRSGLAEEARLVRVESLSEGRVRLSFEPVAPSPEHEVMAREEAQAVLTVFHAAFLAERPEIQVVSPSRLRLLEEGTRQQQLRGRFLERFGPALLPLPDSLEESRLYRALKLSPRYMGAGVREAAQEMFSSPLFVASVCLSVLVYFAAWLAPEPLFTKALAGTVTAALAIAVGVLEVANLALACIRLYRESEAASSEEELEAASERFGKSVGGTGLRVMVLVASFGIGKSMPSVPHGGLGALLGPPRYAVEGGLALGRASTAKVVADGSLILSGVATGEAATHLCGGLAMCSTMDEAGPAASNGGELLTRYGPPHTRQNPRHNNTIERELAAREAAGHTDLKKNKGQLDANGEDVRIPRPAGRPHYRRPDASSLRPDGVRHNTNYVSNVRNLRSELEAFETMRKADPRAIHELYLLDGTLIRRYVPAGVTFP